MANVQITLTTHTTLAHLYWHLHAVEVADGEEDTTVALHGGFIPLGYGESAILDAQMVLRAVADHLDAGGTAGGGGVRSVK